MTVGRYARHRTYTSDCRVHHLAMDARAAGFQPETLREAALLLGGERKLAEFLDIEFWLVSRWLGGLGQPPDFVVSRCVDLVESRKQPVTVANERDKTVRGSDRSGSCPAK